jgi:hypothetical protein
MAERKDIEIFFRIEGLEAYITDLETLDSVLKQVNTATKQTKESTDKLEQSTENFDELERRLGAMEGGVKTLAGSLEFLAGAASLLGVEDNEFFKSLEENTLGVLALARGAIDVSEGYSLLMKNTQLAKVAQQAYNAVANANPYVLLATAILALGGAVATYVIATQDATEETGKFVDKIISENEEVQRQIDLEKRLADARGILDKEAEIDFLNKKIAAQTTNNRQLQDEVYALKYKDEVEGGLSDTEKERYETAKKTLTTNKEKLRDYQDEIKIIQAQIEAEREREKERKKAADAEEARRKAAERRAAQAALEAELTLKQFEEGRERELEALRRKYEEDVELAQGNTRLLKLINEQLARDIEAINAEYRANELKAIDVFNTERLNKEREVQEQTSDLIKEAIIQRPSTTSPIPVDDTPDTWLVGWQKAFDSFAEAPEEVFNGLRRDSESAINFLSALNEGFTKDEEKRAKRGFQLQKALSLATATINGTEAVINAFKTATANPITTVFPAYPYLAATAAGALAAAQIAAIKRQQFEGGGNEPDVNVPPPAVPSVNYSFQQQPGQSIIPGQNSAGQQGPIQAYVLVSDVNNAQQAQQQIDNLRKL